MKPSEICLKAKDVLRERGWTQGRMRNDDGAFCVWGALVVADAGRVTLDYSMSAAWARSALAAAVGDPSVGLWNDVPGRTLDEVLAALDQAAERLRGEGR